MHPNTFPELCVVVFNKDYVDRVEGSRGKNQEGRNETKKQVSCTPDLAQAGGQADHPPPRGLEGIQGFQLHKAGTGGVVPRILGEVHPDSACTKLLWGETVRHLTRQSGQWLGHRPQGRGQGSGDPTTGTNRWRDNPITTLRKLHSLRYTLCVAQRTLQFYKGFIRTFKGLKVFRGLTQTPKPHVPPERARTSRGGRTQENVGLNPAGGVHGGGHPRSRTELGF